MFFFAFFVTNSMSIVTCRTTNTSKSSCSILLLFFVLYTPLFAFNTISASAFQTVIVLYFLQFPFVIMSVFFVSSSCYNFVQAIIVPDVFPCAS